MSSLTTLTSRYGEHSASSPLCPLCRSSPLHSPLSISALKVPLVLAPMLGASNGTLAGAVSKAGGLGFVAWTRKSSSAPLSEVDLQLMHPSLSPCLVRPSWSCRQPRLRARDRSIDCWTESFTRCRRPVLAVERPRTRWDRSNGRHRQSDRHPSTLALRRRLETLG